MTTPCLLLVGPVEWHKKLLNTFKKNNDVWMQYNDHKFKYQVQNAIVEYFKKQIEEDGYFIIYGYSKGTNQVTHIYSINNFKCSRERIPPPSDSYASFSDYDKLQGGCKDQNDYKYPTWLHAEQVIELPSPVHYSDFTTFPKGKNLVGGTLQKSVLIVNEHPGLKQEFKTEAIEHKSIIADPIEFEITDIEGRPSLRTHLQKERSSKLISAFKSSLSSCNCCICGFDFEKTYGEIGAGFIEAHHIKPVSSFKKGELVSTKDLVAVCSNCHRMIHMTNPMLDWEKLKKMLRERNK